MTDYRQLMRLLLQQRPYREIAARLSCSQRTIAKARHVLEKEHLDHVSQVEALTAEDLDRLFSDGRKSVTGEFAPIRSLTRVMRMCGGHGVCISRLLLRIERSMQGSGGSGYGS
jgi:hypothetical protein